MSFYRPFVFATDAQPSFAGSRDLYSIPTDLRARLEDCLGEDASPVVLEQHMPRIKHVIYRLLIGLKGKQEPYRLAMAERRKATR